LQVALAHVTALVHQPNPKTYEVHTCFQSNLFKATLPPQLMI